jgi:hypothetical protein
MPKIKPKKPPVERDTDWIPVAQVAEAHGVTPRAWLRRAKTDPDFPRVLSNSAFERARKFHTRGDVRRYDQLRQREADRERQQRLAARAEART